MHHILKILVLSTLFVSPCLGDSDSVIVFNEIMYHPTPNAEAEWVELHNQMSVDIDLSRWQLEGGTQYSFPERTIIPGGGYLVIAAVPEADMLGPLVGRLNNAGDSLRLISASGRLMNEVRYNDRGAWPVAPDGSGASLAKVVRDSAAPDAANWSWSHEVGGTPGALNFAEDTLPNREVVINEVSGASEDAFSIELFNRTAANINISGRVLSRSSTTEDHVFESAWVVSPEDFPGGAASGVKLFLYGPGKTTVLDAVEVKTRSRKRSPDGEGALTFTTEMPTVTDIVINEIFYHHRPQYRDGETPFAEIDGEWIELYHRGDTVIDLTGWELDGDIQFAFEDGTMLEPGAYLVIDNGGVGFQGNLPNTSGDIILKDPAGNPADEVTYHDDGHWPKAADGGGSSLELRDPYADNDSASAWAASDELARGGWQEITYRGLAESSPVGQDNQWRELVIGLLDRGEILIDDIQVTEDPDGRKAPLVNNSSFQASIFGGTALRNWRFRGNHRHSELVPDPDDPNNNVVKLVATGATGHMHNHMETTFSGGSRITNGETYEISFRARALSGSPQLLTRLYFNRLPKTHILATPSESGTPGQPNSTLESNIGPTFSGLHHQPAVPEPNQACTVSVQASDRDGIAEMKLLWSIDGGDISELAMTITDSGTYEAAVPAQAAGAVIHFYVEATDAQGTSSQWPSKGPDSRALYQVEDGRGGNAALNHLRIIMRPDDADWMHESINVMSNDRLPATVIYKEKEVFYDVGVRLKGSERGRVTNQRIGFNVKFPNQQRFRGIHRTVAIDRSEGVGTGQFELLFNQMMTHSGSIPAEYNDLIHVISPRAAHTGAAELQLARYTSVFLDSQFDNGSDGNLYEYELIYYPTSDDADGYKRPSPDSVVGTPVRDLGDDQEDYRWNFLLKNNRERNDFTPIMRYAKLFSMNDANFQAALPGLVDVERWLQGMALALLTGAGDQYGANSQHNGMFYERPDGKFIFFPHDVDFAFNASRSITENSDLKKIIKNPAYERLYLAHVNNILTTTLNESYMTRWAEHFGELLPGQNFNSHLNYMVSRASSARSQVARMAPQTNFGITTNGGSDLEVSTSTVALEGNGNLNLHQLRHNESGLIIAPEWIDLETWRIVVPLEPGPNVITLQGLDVKGGVGSIFSPVGKDSITITNTGAFGPVTSENFVISEIMYHPSDSSAEEIANGFTDANDFEYIEILNAADHAIDLSDVSFINGIRMGLSGTLESGERAVVVRNADAFTSRYGNDARVLGAWGDSKLSNQGERLTVERDSGEVLKSFRYDNGTPWPEAADGEGASLVLISPENNPVPNEETSWQASITGGTPGNPDESLPPVGGAADIVRDLTVSLEADRTLVLSYVRSRDPQLTFVVEVSEDLNGWTIVPDVIVTTEAIDDTTEKALVKAVQPAGSSMRFTRLKILSQ